MTKTARSASASPALASRIEQQVLLAAAAALAVLAVGATTAHAQQQQPNAAATAAASQRRANVVDRNNENPNTLALIDRAAGEKMTVTADDLYRGFRATRLLGQDVKGPNGKEIGEVQDILVDHEGKIAAIVVEAGGFLDIGDAAFRVKWSDVKTTPGQDGIEVPITEATAERYGLFDGPETLAPNPREFRVSEIIGDSARLRNGTGYGRVSNVVFGRDGRMLGVLVGRDIGYGAGIYGYPYYGYGYGWTPGLAHYALPYDNAGLAARAPRIDYGRFMAAEKEIL